MSSETMRLIKREEAISILERVLKNLKASSDEFIFGFEMDFDLKQTKCEPYRITITDGKKLIDKAASIMYCGDPICSHLDLYSMIQNDVEKIIKKGKVNSLMLLHREGGS